MIEWAVAPLRNRNGQSAFVIVISSDVTTSRELERLKSQFVAIVRPAGDLAEVMADPDRSIQVLVNLLSNAVGDVAGHAMEAVNDAARQDDADVLADPDLAAILAPDRKLQVRRLLARADFS